MRGESRTHSIEVFKILGTSTGAKGVLYRRLQVQPWGDALLLGTGADAEGVACWIQHDNESVFAVRLRCGRGCTEAVEVAFHLFW